MEFRQARLYLHLTVKQTHILQNSRSVQPLNCISLLCSKSVLVIYYLSIIMIKIHMQTSHREQNNLDQKMHWPLKAIINLWDEVLLGRHSTH